MLLKVHRAAYLLLALTCAYAVVADKYALASNGQVASPAQRTSPERDYQSGRKLEGAGLAQFLKGKFLRPIERQRLSFPGLHFHAPGKVIVTSAQGLLSENATYQVNGDQVCLTQRSVRDLNCFGLSVVGHREAIAHLRINGTSTYVGLRAVEG
jgi:hypothetical protein